MSDRSPYRIAMRREGENVNVYWALADSMVGAELIAHCRVEVLEDAPDLLEGFKALCAMFSVELIRKRLGVGVKSIETVDAPEHERAGRA